MNKHAATLRGALFLALAWGLGTPASAADPKVSPADPLHIGLINTLFRDVPKPLACALMQPFRSLVETQTGLDGRLTTAEDAFSLGRQLAEDKVQLGVFQGIEFAWARQKYPDLRPLMIVVNQDAHLRAFLVVRSDSGIAGFADLKGKALAIPRQTREHCYQFVQRHCRDVGLEPRSLLSGITRPANAEDALDDVVDGVVQAAIVEGLALQRYQQRKPGRAAVLKTAVESEVFPAGVIAYHAGALDEATLNRFRQGMLASPQNPLGRQLMTLWHVTGFETVPADYQETLTRTAKAYPPPPS